MSLVKPAYQHQSRNDTFPVISIAAPSEHPRAGPRHIVAVVGPDTEDNVRTLADDCFMMGLSLRVLRTDSDEFTDETLDRLYASGEMGPNTQLIVLAHGENLSGKHVFTSAYYRPDGKEGIYAKQHQTMGLLTFVRQTHQVDPQTAERLTWKGMAHIFSCGDQVLARQLAASNQTRACGYNLVYGDAVCLGRSEASHALRNICEFICQHGSDAPVSPTAMLAWVGKAAAVPVTLVGEEVRSPIELQPATSVLEAMPAFMPGRLRQLQAEASCDAAHAAADRLALRQAVKAARSDDGRPDSALLEQKLARMVHEEVICDRFDHVAELFSDAPQLANTINGFARPLSAAVNPDHRAQYRKLVRKADRKSNRHGRIAERSAQPPKNSPEQDRAGRARLQPFPTAVPQAQYRQETLLEAIARRLAQEPGNAPLLLQRACEQGDVEMFAALYQAAGLALFRDAALIRSCSNQAMPPLHMACLIDAPELVTVLVDGGADADLLDRSGKTALYHAVERKSLPLVRALKAAGADCATRTNGKDPAELAAQTGFDAGFAILADAGYWRSRALAGARLKSTRTPQAPHS